MRGGDPEQLSVLQGGRYYRIAELENTQELYIGELAHFTEVKRKFFFPLTLKT